MVFTKLWDLLCFFVSLHFTKDYKSNYSTLKTASKKEVMYINHTSHRVTEKIKIVNQREKKNHFHKELSLLSHSVSSRLDGLQYLDSVI